MKAKKILAAIMAAAMMMSVMAACSKDDEEETTAADATDAEVSDTEATEADTGLADNDAYILYNGVELRIGGSFAEVESALGETTSPDEEVVPCGVGDQVEINHHYAGCSVMENSEGAIIYIDLSDYYDDQSATLNGEVGIGGSVDVVLSILGTPSDEGEYYLQYQYENYTIDVVRNPEDQTVTGISFNGDYTLYI